MYLIQTQRHIREGYYQPLEGTGETKPVLRGERRMNRKSLFFCWLR